MCVCFVPTFNTYISPECHLTPDVCVLQVCVSNVNRQVHALDGQIGRLKVEAMRDRLLQIHPWCNVSD